MIDYTHEKLLFGLPMLAASILCSMGAIMTADEIRWIYVTLAVGIMTSSFLAILVRKPGESIRIVIARCGISILLSVFGSKIVVHIYKIAGTENDVLLLSSIAFGICVLAYTIGHAFIVALARNSETAGTSLFQLLMLVLRTLINRKP